MMRITKTMPVCLGLVTAVAAFNTPAATAQSPSVSLRKTCPNLRYVGRTATFEINVANNGDGAAYDVVVTDVIPNGIDFRNADNGATRQGDKIVWRVGTLKAGESRTLKSNFLCNRIGRYKNRASVTYCASANDECELEVKGIPAILLECVDDPDPIEIGGSVTYTITVTNQGSATGTNISIICTLPPQQELVNTNGPTNATSQGKVVTFAPLPTLAPKAKAIFRVTIKGVATGDTRFHVSLKSDQMETPAMETESTHIYE